MRLLYFECNAGASGDMIMSSLADLLDDPSSVSDMIMSAGIPGVKAEVLKGEKSHIGGTRVKITVDGIEEGEEHHHVHRKLSDVSEIIDSLNISDKVKKDASSIYWHIANAESEAHKRPVSEVHFHEVGALDAIADIVGVCMVIEKLSPDLIMASPVRTGYGEVKCAHGLLPIPAPATASILKDMPCYAGEEEGEFCTPTGAAILKHFVSEFGRMPPMTFDRIGYGLGKKEFSTANILRAFIGDQKERLPSVDQIECDIDDMTPEDLGGIVDYLLSQGAIDASVRPSMMKKSRMGYALVCLCRTGDTERLAKIILQRTTTIGVRVLGYERYAMTSRFDTCETEYGEVRIKVSEGFGIVKWKPEYDDLKRLADAAGVSTATVRKAVRYDPKA